jgi:predicted porin
MGTVLVGRNFGLFAFDAIINDMTLLGVGAAFASANPGHTSLGGLGFGYVYTDRLAQINYTTPDFSGFKATLGVFQPLNGVATVGDANNSSGIGFQGKASYQWEGTVKGTLSTSFLTQGMDVTAAGKTTNVYGWDVFGKVGFDNFDFLAYYYQAEGMTTLAIGGLIFPGFDGITGDGEESKGYMLQGTYTFGNTRFGINWAESKQTEVTRVDNEKLTLGVYHNLTPALTLVGEYSNQQGDLRDVGTDKTWNFNLGAILFF